VAPRAGGGGEDAGGAAAVRGGGSSGASPAGVRQNEEGGRDGPLVNPRDVTAVWAATKEAAGRGAPSAWLTHFSLGMLDAAAGTAELVPRPGLGGGGRSLAIPERLQKLGVLMSQVVGRPVRVALGSAAASGAAPAGGPDDAPETDGDAAVNRREALALPLVREALDVFPEATFLSARRRPAPGAENL